jgi:hypothetical protein
MSEMCYKNIGSLIQVAYCTLNALYLCLEFLFPSVLQSWSEGLNKIPLNGTETSSQWFIPNINNLVFVSLNQIL